MPLEWKRRVLTTGPSEKSLGPIARVLETALVALDNTLICLDSLMSSQGQELHWTIP